MKAMVSRVILAFVPFFAVPMFMSGCSGCEDVRLIRTCSHRTVDKTPCDGSKEIFEEFKGNPDDYNVGVCRIGTIQCRRDVETVEEFCPTGAADCLDQWDYAQYDDLCIGHITPKVEQCGNEIDEDCDGQTNEGYDLDGDGYEDFNKTDENGHRCGYDCDDQNPNINPSAEEICDGLVV